MENVKPKIVVSAINIFGGGTLSVLNDFLSNLVLHYSNNFDIIALVYKKDIVKKLSEITVLEFPNSRKSYLFRLFYEYIYFKKLSKQLNPYLWISLNDTSPSVSAQKKAVYCHNPSIFYKVTLKDVFFSPYIYFFTLVYKFIYKINIRKNNFVIVQQNWINQKFREIYNIKNVITAYPEVSITTNNNNINTNEQFVFYFPSVPSSFKNFEVIGEAVKILKNKNISNFLVILTLNGTENRYSKYIYKKFSKFKEIKFTGLIPREEVFKTYETTDCLIFPSKLETWGLPITEFKSYNKPIIASDLPYAHETIGDYDKANFFNPDSPEELAAIMIAAINGNDSAFKKHKASSTKPDASNWKELLDIIINN